MRLPALVLAAAVLAHAACALAAHDTASTLPLKDVDRFKDKEPITDKSMLGAEPKKGLENYDPAKRLNPLEEGLGYAEQQKPVTLKPDEALKNRPGKGADDSTAKADGANDGLSVTDDDGIVEPRYLRYGSYQQPVYTQQQQPFVQQPLTTKSDAVVPAQFSAADEGAARFGRGFGRGFGGGWGGGWGGARALRGGWGRGFGGGWGRGYGWGRGFGYGRFGYGGLYGGYYGGGYPYYGGYGYGGYGVGYPYTTYYTAPYYGAGYYGYGFPAYRGFYGRRRFGRWW